MKPAHEYLAKYIELPRAMSGYERIAHAIADAYEDGRAHGRGLGMFEDDADLIDEVCESAMVARERRGPGDK